MADLSRGPLEPEAIREAEIVAFYLPMHTATKLALRAMAKVREWSPEAKLLAYGLYAPMNEEALRQAGVEAKTARASSR